PCSRSTRQSSCKAAGTGAGNAGPIRIDSSLAHSEEFPRARTNSQAHWGKAAALVQERSKTPEPDRPCGRRLPGEGPRGLLTPGNNPVLHRREGSDPRESQVAEAYLDSRPTEHGRRSGVETDKHPLALQLHPTVAVDSHRRGSTAPAQRSPQPGHLHGQRDPVLTPWAN